MPAPPPAQADIWHALVTADAAALSALRLSNSCGSPSRSSIPRASWRPLSSWLPVPARFRVSSARSAAI